MSGIGSGKRYIYYPLCCVIFLCVAVAWLPHKAMKCVKKMAQAHILAGTAPRTY